MMLPESRADQSCGGYGGLARISPNGVPSYGNRMEIYSRFRPIAPKPSTPKPGESAGSAPSDPPSSSTVSFERTSGGKAVSSERSRVKRSRKPNGSEPFLPPTRRVKRGPTAVKPRVVSFKGAGAVGGIQKAVEQFAPDKTGLRLVPPISTGGEYRLFKEGASDTSHGAGMQHTDFVVTGDASELQASGWVRPDRRKYSNGFGALTFTTPQTGSEKVPCRFVSPPDACVVPTMDSPGCEQPAFVNRAGGCTSLQIFGRDVNEVEKLRGGCDRGLYNYPKCNSDGQSYGVPYVRPLDISLDHPFAVYVPDNDRLLADQFSFARSIGESEVISDGNSRHSNLVTLSLLPNTPSQSTNSSIPIRPTTSNGYIPCLELTMVTDTRDWKETKPESPEGLHKLSLFNRYYVDERRNGFCETDRDHSAGVNSSREEDSRAGLTLLEREDRMPRLPASCRDSEDSVVALTDTAHVEQQYSASSDPVMLSDVLSGEILWANQAYMKADAERNQRLGKAKNAGAPYLDILGVPLKLASFEFLTLQGTRTKANLWGFLKKFMTSESEPNRVSSLSKDKLDGDDKAIRTSEGKSSYTTEEDFSQTLKSSRSKLITPQPIRPVGSTLTLERVCSTDHYASPITENVERVKEQLELRPLPCVITDLKNRVNWVNTAYKQFVGQPECAWLASTVGVSTNRDSSQQSRLMGEVMLTCEEQLSKLSAQFSCRVQVRWTNGTEENSMILPTDVARIENDKRVVMFVWKLDPYSPTTRFASGGPSDDSLLINDQ